MVRSDAFAGTERYVVQLAGAQAAAGHDLVVIGGATEAMQSAAGDGAGRIAFDTGATVTEVIRRLVRHRPFDVVHAHLTAAEIAAVTAFPRPGRSPLLVCSRHIAGRRGSNPAARVAAAWVRHRMAGQIAPSQFIADRVDGACTVIPTGIPATELGAHTEKVVLVAQRLEPEKDTATAIRAWKHSRLSEEGWEMHIAGEGTEELALRRLATSLEVSDSCRFLGRVDDVPERMASAGMVLCTATAEPFGLVVLEAMAAGTPVVASASGGHLETVGAAEGAVLFEVGDYEEAGNLIRRLAEDTKACDDYGLRLQALQRDRFSVDRFARSVEDWYGTLMAPDPR